MTPRGSRLYPYPQPTLPRLTLLEEMVMVLIGAGSWKKMGISFGPRGLPPCPAPEVRGQQLVLRRAWAVPHPP